MVSVLKLGMMGVYMKAIIRPEKSLDKVLIIGQISQFIKEIGMMEEFREKENMFILMVRHTKDALLTI